MPLLTDEIERRMTAYKEKEGNKDHRLPRFDTVAKSLNISNADAKTMLNEYRTKHEGRVRTEPQGPPQTSPQPEKEKWHHKAAKLADWMVDSGTILTAVIIDLVLSGICLYIMGPSALEKVAFVSVAFVIVLFGLRALMKGNTNLWLRCAILAGFLDTSFVMVGIDYQTNRTASDRQLEVLETAESNASAYLEELKSKQLEKGEGYKGQIDTWQAVFNAASAKASEYRALVASKPKEAPTIKAYDIFLAIPRALVGHWVNIGSEVAMIIALLMFGTIFWVLQETLYTTVVRKKE